MNDQETSAPRDPATPRRLQDFEHVRRPRSDRMIAGVSTGIAHWLGIDPVVVRVAFVVLTLVGLSGLILYGACWLLVPEEGRDRSVLGEALGLGTNEKQVRLIGLVIAGAVAVAAVLGDSAWGLGGGAWITLWVLFWIALPVGVVYWLLSARRRRGGPAVPPPGTPYGPPTSAAPPAGADVPPSAPTGPVSSAASDSDPVATTTIEGSADEADDTPAQPPHGPYAPPPMAGPPPPAAPRTPWSPALFLGTISLILLSWGGLWLWSEQVGTVIPEVYAGVGLGITALGLLIGTRIGDAGLLVPVGLVLAVVLATTSMFPSTRAGDYRYTPVSVEQATRTIDTGAGQVVYDLTELRDPEELAGQSVEIRHGVGVVRVIVPRDVEVDVDATMRLGSVVVFGRHADGFDQRVEDHTDGDDAFDISIHSSLGLIEVTRS